MCGFICVSQSSFKLIIKFEYKSFTLPIQVDKLGKDSFVNCAKTSMSSKLIGGDSDFFANLVSYYIMNVWIKAYNACINLSMNRFYI